MKKIRRWYRLLWYGRDPFDTPTWRILTFYQAQRMASGYSVGRPGKQVYVYVERFKAKPIQQFLDREIVKADNDMYNRLNKMLWGDGGEEKAFQGLKGIFSDES